MDRNRILVIVLIIILVGAGAYFLTKDNNKQTSSSTTSTQPTTQTPTQPNETQSTDTEASKGNPQSATTITYDGSSFSPATLTVKSGTVVTVKNSSSDDLQFDSDPHPVHTDDTDLNVGVISAGSSMTFTANKTGTFGYHNHLDPSQTGTITIQ